MSSPPLNEAAVCGEIIAPLLRALGYHANTNNDVLYQLSLRYPHDFLGRKKSKDPLLRGKADYTCKAGGRVSWVIEAKSAAADITTDAIEQAYTYARHPEVRAVYFCLCTGSEFRVYAVDGTPEYAEIFRVDPRDTEKAAAALRPTLGPAALLRRFAEQVADTEPPIGPGLLSFAQIVRGSVTHQQTTPRLRFMEGFTVSVTGGALQRTDQGLLAYWEAQGPFASIQRLIERLGLTRVEAFAPANSLSTDPTAPTVFTMHSTAVFPKGETLRDLEKHQDVVLPTDIHCDLKITATGVLIGTTFQGSLVMEVDYKTQPPDSNGLQSVVQLTSHGEFEFQLK